MADGMKTYSIRFKDHDGNVYGLSTIHHTCDEEAVSAAESLNGLAIEDAFELWHGYRLVHVHPCQPVELERA